MKSYARHTNGKKIKVIQVKAVTPAQKKTLLEKAEKEQFIKRAEWWCQHTREEWGETLSCSGHQMTMTYPTREIMEYVLEHHGCGKSSTHLTPHWGNNSITYKFACY